MKYFGFYSILSFLIIVINAKPNIHLGCKLGDPIPHPTDCKKFLICGLTDYESECDWPLLFNDKTKSCDLPQNVNCSPLNLPHQSADKQISRLPFYADVLDTSNSISCTSGAVVPHPNECSLFIKCGPTDLDNIILRCTNSTLFNPQTSRCEMANRVACKTYTFLSRPIDANYTTKPTPTEFLYCRPSCFFPHPTDCNKFILCGKTLKENRVFTCPTSLLYNPYVQTCDLPQNVVCKIYNYEFVDDLNLSRNTTALPTTTMSITTNEFMNTTNSSIIINMTTTENSNLTTTTQLMNATTESINTTTLEFSYSTQTMNTTTTIVIDTNSTILNNETQTTSESLNTTISTVTNPKDNATNTTETTITLIETTLATSLSQENMTTTSSTTLETTLTTATVMTNLTTININATGLPLNTTELMNSTVLLSETTTGFEQLVTNSTGTSGTTVSDVTNLINIASDTTTLETTSAGNEITTTLAASNETTISTLNEF